MKEINLEQYVGKRVKIITNDNQEIIGKAFGFTQALDNEPEIDEIDIHEDKNEGQKIYTGILQTEIQSIEILE